PLDLPDRYFVVSHPLDVSMLCYLIRPVRPQYPVPVRWNRGLQSRFLQCMPHGKPPCDLLTLRGVTPARKGLAPSGILWYIRYQMPMPGTHRRLAQWRVKCFYDSLVQVYNLVPLMN